MTIFISDSTPQSPAFLYATYPAGTTVASSPVSSAYTAADVLQADELNGWRPAGTAGSHTLTISFARSFPVEFFAIAGKDLDGVVLEVRGSTDGFVASNVQLVSPRPLVGSIAAWGKFQSGSYGNLRFIFSGHSSVFMVKHIACGPLIPLTCLADGACFAPLQAEGEHLISTEGLYLGSVTQKVMRPFSLSFGQIMPVEEAAFADMVAACVKSAQGLFWVPDLSQPAVHFGAIDKKYKYEPRMSKGTFTIPAIPFTARAV